MIVVQNVTTEEYQTVPWQYPDYRKDTFSDGTQHRVELPNLIGYEVKQEDGTWKPLDNEKLPETDVEREKREKRELRTKQQMEKRLKKVRDEYCNYQRDVPTSTPFTSEGKYSNEFVIKVIINCDTIPISC